VTMGSLMAAAFAVSSSMVFCVATILP